MELLAQSSFSFLRGTTPPELLLVKAAEQGHRALAVVDDNGFYGSARAQMAARKHGVHAIVGTTLTQVPFLPVDRLPILVKNRAGYRYLSSLLTQIHLTAPPKHPKYHFPQGTCPPWPADLMAVPPPPAHGVHAILTPNSLEKGTKTQWLEAAKQLLAVFGPLNLSVAIYRHRKRGQERINRLLFDLADHLKLPLLAANAPIYLSTNDRALADAFTCLRHHRALDTAGQLLEANDERHLKSPAELADLFSDLPQAVIHAHELADRCDFSLDNLGYQFPAFRDPRNDKPLPQADAHKFLTRLAEQGLGEKIKQPSSRYRQQLTRELALIDQLSFSGYFLIVWDIFHYAKGQGILCQGRGSAANSLVCYLIGVTAVDPIDSNLLFERFLSENRTSWPDIDIDLPSGERREAVIQYVFEKYAPLGAAMTANVITYRPRSAFREMSKVLGFGAEIADRFSEFCTAPKVHDDHPGGRKPTPGGEHPTEEVSMHNYYSADRVMDFMQTVERAGIPATHPRLPALLHLYQAALHQPRHLGQHSGGMIICDTGLDQVVPIEPATMPGRTVVQWDKDDCEDLGIVKVDLLGLGMLAAMEDALIVCRQRGQPVDLSQISKNDEKTYDLMCAADTVGTFQVESRAQMSTLPIMQPRTFYDVAVEVAIIRPGPIVGDLVHPYLNRRTGREPVDYPHPLTEPILERTLGVPLFQEQVLRMAMVLADFTGSEADDLRRAMTYKRSDVRMKEVTAKLEARMTKKGIHQHVQEEVIHSIGSFALYGFPESHAISFGLIAYASCWLKAHRPAEFYCGLVNNQPMGFYSVNTLLQDAKRHHVRAKPVCVLQSQIETIVIDDNHLRLGLHRLKGLRQATAERLVEQRVRAQFSSLGDFLRRVEPNVKERRLLAAAGALNELPEVGHRRQALWLVENPPQEDLFGWQSQVEQSSTPLLPMTIPERLATDLTLQGATTGLHPLKLWRRAVEGQRPEELRDVVLQSAKSLPMLPHGAKVVIPGLVICRQRPGTAKGHCFISLEDEFGIANVFIPRKTYHEHRLLISAENFLLIHGHAQITEGRQSTIYAYRLEALPAAPRDLPTDSHDFH